MNNNSTFVANFAHTYPAGIDKIEAQTKEFDIKDTFHFTIIPNYKKQGQTEIEHRPLFTCQGQQVYGSKAFHNAETEFGNLSVNIDWRGLKTIWNPSKFAGKYSGELASPMEAYNQLEIIQKYLTEVGLLINLSGSKFTRFDLAKDRWMNNKVFTYKPAFDWLNGKRMKEHVLYPDGVRIGNKQKQAITYDKGLELSPDNGSTNIMRCEMGILKPKSVQRVMNISHLHQLKDLGQDDLSNIYSNFITKDIFRMGEFNQLSFDFMNEVTIMRSFKEQGYNGFDKWLKLHGIEKVLSLFNLKTLKEIMQESGFDRYAVRRAIQEVNRLSQISSFLRTDEQTTGKMFEEIRQKFAS